MRPGLIGALALLLLVAPAAAPAAPPATYPSAADVSASTPALAAQDAACIAGYYRGRLTRTAWRTPYYKLTRSEKLVTDRGFEHCMTLRERTTLIERQDTRSLGRHTNELRCSARRMARRSTPHLLAITSLAQAVADNDAVYRGCHLIGVLYSSLAASTELRLTPAETECANRTGSADPLRNRGKTLTIGQRTAIGRVLDACVGRTSETAMWTRLLKSFRPSGAIPCIAKRSVAITFVTFFSDRAGLQRAAKRAATHCVLPGSGT
ncbi:MAG: hypothetical protein QOI71_3309 [Gaiellales bacterium]|jgi:hypothetical protein|nr:hypothetical protein [Gaiellales bacterium]